MGGWPSTSSPSASCSSTNCRAIPWARCRRTCCARRTRTSTLPPRRAEEAQEQARIIVITCGSHWLDDSATPAQGRGMHRRVPEITPFVIQQRNRDRTAGHFKGRYVVADQGARYGEPARLQQRPSGAMDKVKFHRRGAAEAVDQQQCLATCPAAEVAEDGRDHLVGNGGDRGQRD